MFSDLPQFVPQSVCLSCDGCCRFKEEQSSWRPKAVGDEKVQGGLAEEIFSRQFIRGKFSGEEFVRRGGLSGGVSSGVARPSFRS